MDATNSHKRKFVADEDAVSPDGNETGATTDRSAFESEWQAIVQDALSTIGEGDMYASGRPLTLQFKVLSAAPGKGRQVLHWDIQRPEPHQPGANTISVIMYCTPCQSTAVPRFPASQLNWPPEEKDRLQAKAFLLEDQFYHSVPVQAGTLLLMRQSTPHFGMANTNQRCDRVVLFDMLSPETTDNQGTTQFFKWMFIREAFGTRDLRFAACLQACLVYMSESPLLREGEDRQNDGKDIEAASITLVERLGKQQRPKSTTTKQRTARKFQSVALRARNGEIQC
jgi:hypothetical protein